MAVWLTYIILLASFNFIYARFFPIEGINIGHDYSFMFPAWLDGLIWFKKNGLDIPWFSPSFCAGQPFFPDPQSTFYSVPQLINLVASPLNTAFITLLISASLLYWGGYLLMRKVFLSGPAIGVFIGGILMFNGFIPHRIVIGHVTFHGFALVPWICLLLLVPVRSRFNGVMAAVAAGTIVAYWVHSGFGTLILPGALSIFLVALVTGLQGKPLATFFLRGALASVIGIGLASAKLWAAFSFLSNFPRTDYLIPGAASLGDTILVIVSGLFLPSEWSYRVGGPKLVNVQWGIGPHEWAYNFGFITALLGLVLIVDAARSGRLRVSFAPRQLCILLLLVLCLAWPLAFNFYEPTWNAVLKTIPIVNSTSAPIRWIIVYIPIIAVMVGLLLNKSKWQGHFIPIVGGWLLFTVLQAALEPRDFYLGQAYDSRPISIADSMRRSGRFQPGIQALHTTVDMQIGSVQLKLGMNDTLFAGVSQIQCYNPVFGYKLEKFSAANLRKGPVLVERDGYLNLKNPACYVYPKENNCRPGDLFRADQLDQAKAFVNYQPFAFNMSESQKRANQLSLLSMGFVLLMGIGWLFIFSKNAWRMRRVNKMVDGESVRSQ